MYLARKRVKGRTCYFIRESFYEGRVVKSRDLFDLGSDPEDYIIYPDDGHAFYFDEGLCEALEEKGVPPDNDRLEKVFWPFIDPEARRQIEAFTRPPAGRGARLKNQAKRCETADFHLFDRRRVHFLRFGEMDQTRLPRAPKKIYRKLLDKSRDEIEQQFIEMEQVLKPPEKKNYTFVIFNVAGYFSSPIARKFPQALPEESVDACFLDSLCRLNADPDFWLDIAPAGFLHEYLIRYICWFFDTDFEGGSYLDDLIWQFKRRHHGFRPPPPPRKKMAVDETLKVMGIDKGDLAGMTVKTLSRQYRLMAKKYHPDQGGGHEKFIRLNRAFEDLLRRIKARRQA